MVTVTAGDQPECCAPFTVRARTEYLPARAGSNRWPATVPPETSGRHLPVPRRVCTSKVVAPLARLVDHRSAHPAPGEPVALTGTATRPRIIAWIEQW